MINQIKIIVNGLKMKNMSPENLTGIKKSMGTMPNQEKPKYSLYTDFKIDKPKGCRHFHYNRDITW